MTAEIGTVTRRHYVMRVGVVFVFVLLGIVIVWCVVRKRRRDEAKATDEAGAQDDGIEAVDKPPFNDNRI